MLTTYIRTEGSKRSYVVTLTFVTLKDLRGRPEAILAEIDDWSKDNKILMSTGQERGAVITDLIAKTKPKVMAELGGYIGFSAVKFGSAA